MTLKDIAKTFNMSISQLATVMGYTRQALYKGPKYSDKSREAIKTLMALNNTMRYESVRAVNMAYDARSSAINALEQLFMDGGVSKNG